MESQIHASGEQLENAFAQFNQFSEQLADSFGDLQAQVAELSYQLSQARSERLIQLAEKEVLAKRLAGLLDVLPAGIVVLDSNDCITEMNPLAHQMFGEYLTGEKWDSVAKSAILSSGKELRLQDGRWIDISACSLGKEPGKIILVSDVSEIHSMQDMLSRQQRMSSLGEMVASLAHQIRTPLASALLYLTTISHPKSNPKQIIHSADKARERLHYLDRMVNDMLLFAKGDVAKEQTIEVSVFLRRLKYLLEPGNDVNQFLFIIDNNLQHILIEANRDALFGAIQNIVDNAVQACESTKKIVIKARLNKSKQFELAIKDSGCGISDEEKERILEPFYTTKANGTGLGLSVVNSTINCYGGTLSIVSCVGEGSTFTITLPVCDVTGVLPSSNENNGLLTASERKALHKQGVRNTLKLISGKGGI